jgi:hypothetical protein
MRGTSSFFVKYGRTNSVRLRNLFLDIWFIVILSPDNYDSNSPIGEFRLEERGDYEKATKRLSSMEGVS